jgi:ABC-2 type transport system permease protein
MWHLLSLEWQKQRRFSLFKILIIGYALLLPGFLLIGKKMEVTGTAPFNPKVMFYQFPTVWDWLAYTGNWLIFFVFGFMAVLLVTNEYSSRTLRQNIITGLHRHEFLRSKIYFMLIVSLAATVYYAICAIAIGLFHTKGAGIDQIVQHTALIPRYLLMTVGYMSFGLFIGVLIRKTSIALFVFLAYSMFLESIIRWGIHLQLFKNSSFNYYPLNVMEDLCPIPVSGQAAWFMKEKGFSLFLTPMEAAIATGIYVIVFLALAFFRLRKADL